MAEHARLPTGLESKADFYSQVGEQLASLLEGERNWVTNLANASSLLFNAFAAFEPFGNGSHAVNWCGFYIDSSLFPTVRVDPDKKHTTLLLGPFQGRPGCQTITGIQGRGVCADAFVTRQTVLVHDVHDYPGHIACDSETNSEIVIPLLAKGSGGEEVPIGVFDLDCLAAGGFGREDKVGLQAIAHVILKACDWGI